MSITVAGTTLVSLNTDGTQGNGGSVSPSISADGRYVAFVSFASDLVAGDTNGTWDVFVRDTQTGTTTLVSMNTDGTSGSKSSNNPSISSDGRYVAFTSNASDLVAGDTNGLTDVFVRELQAGTTTLISLNTAGTSGNSDSYEPTISADGRYIAFSSSASDLVVGDNNGSGHIFVRDLQAGTTILVSKRTDNTPAVGMSYSPSISADGRYVAFASIDPNLAPGDINGS